jgi:phage baseplate assembly protein W
MNLKSYSTYSDLNESPTSDRDAIIKDVDSVNQAITSMLEIIKGERLFNDSGLDPESELFELGTDGESDDLLNDIVQEIVEYEPRIELNFNKTVIEPDYDNNKYTITIVYTLIGLSTEEFRLVRSL